MIAQLIPPLFSCPLFKVEVDGQLFQRIDVVKGHSHQDSLLKTLNITFITYLKNALTTEITDPSFPVD